MPVTRRRTRRQPRAARMLTELAVASAETIFRRSLLMATGRCTPAEYRKMVEEKAAAARKTATAAMLPGVAAATLLAPWHGAARRNARRLRRK